MSDIKNKIEHRKISGFTIVEMLIAFGIMVVVLIIAGIFSQSILNYGGFFSSSFKIHQEIQLTFAEMIPEIRAMAPSSIGSYAIAEATTSTFVFYSDIDKDGLQERIRYFVSENALKKGFLKPAGSPLSYNPANEIVSNAIDYIANGATPVFTYYDYYYTGTESPMTYPLNISMIRIIGVQITAQKADGQSVASTFDIKITPRNLRSN